MARPLSELLLDFIATLRSAGVRISVAESLDAVRAVSATGLAPARMRESLRASLIKDEADSAVFDRVFADYFAAPNRGAGQPRQSRGVQIGMSGMGRGDGFGINSPPPIASATPSQRLSWAAKVAPGPVGKVHRAPIATDRKTASDRPGLAEEKRDSETVPRGAGSKTETAGHHGQEAAMETADRIPFTDYSALEYEQARELLAVLQRRLRVRLGRRIRRAKAGRIDLRRTLRASIQHGGALIDLRFRARRPRHIDLLVLADISGSVHYATNLMLELLAGAAACFRRVRNFVFIDRLATADFERGHLVMSPNLDLHARSDFGRVLLEVAKRHPALINPATVLVILGDGRNNRRPARADILRDLTQRCRGTIWLNPEPVARWGTGDSAIASYCKVVDSLLACGNLHELAADLASIV
jgi:uncharacterized protein with von Willebrand factor type A (vWA) domain